MDFSNIAKIALIGGGVLIVAPAVLGGAGGGEEGESSKKTLFSGGSSGFSGGGAGGRFGGGFADGFKFVPNPNASPNIPVSNGGGLPRAQTSVGTGESSSKKSSQSAQLAEQFASYKEKVANMTVSTEYKTNSNISRIETSASGNETYYSKKGGIFTVNPVTNVAVEVKKDTPSTITKKSIVIPQFDNGEVQPAEPRSWFQKTISPVTNYLTGGWWR